MPIPEKWFKNFKKIASRQVKNVDQGNSLNHIKTNLKRL